MKAFCKQANINRNRIAQREKEEEMRKFLESLTPEQRADYEKKQAESAERGRQALKNLAVMQSMFRGPYSN